MKKTLCRVEDDGNFFLAYLEDYDTQDLVEGENYQSVPNATLEELADLCDQNAEDDNHHEFVGVHRFLAALLFKRFGRQYATAILTEIAEYGGLDSIGKDSLAEYGVLPCWNDWKLGE